MKRPAKICVFLLGIFLCTITVRAAVTKGKIIGDNINLRAKDSLNAEVVMQMNDGEVVEIKAYGGEWVEIIPPRQADLWVHQDFVQDGLVKVKTLNVRAGPGINFTVVGALARGDRVQERGVMTEWLKIAPLPACSLWVNRKYVGSAAKPKPKPVKKAEKKVIRRRRITQPRPVPVPPRKLTRVQEPSTSAPRPVTQSRVVAAAPIEDGARTELPAKWKLIPLDGQGKRVERGGALKNVGFRIGRPTRFRLMREMDSGRWETICYVRGNREQLQDWVGERIGLRGREYWIQGEKYPVLVVDQLILSTTPLPPAELQ